MQLLELPLDVFKAIIVTMVQELGLQQSMRARFTCRIIADEVLDAVIATRLVEDVVLRPVRLRRISHHHSVIARYLYHRVCTDGSTTHAWINTIRETCRMLAQRTNAENDAARLELLRRSACFCLALNAGSSVFEILAGDEKDNRTPFEGGKSVNCLAVAVWIGDKTLIEAFHWKLDPPSFFGRPSWAAAAQGHINIAQSFLDEDSLLYEPAFNDDKFGVNSILENDLSVSPLCVAAYMGHENITQLHLQSPFYCSATSLEEEIAIIYAAQGDQPTTLKHLLDHYKENSTQVAFLSAIDAALVWSCRRGAPTSVRILLDYGADVNETDPLPRSCLQLAAIANDTQIVKMLLDAGASIEADGLVHRRTSARSTQKKCKRSALWEANRRDNVVIVKLIEEKQIDLNGGDP